MPEFVFSMHNVRKKLGEKLVLDNVTLSFYEGAKIGVVGPNGAGKSTMLKLMAGMLRADNGDAMLSKGKTVGMFQNSNMQLVKETAGEAMCIIGGMPNSLIRSGTVGEIREKTHELCETLGKNGGYVMATYVNELEGCSVENVQAWADATKEFGVYR